MGARTATLTAEEFAEAAGVAPSTVRTWGRRGFPGAEQVTGARGTPVWKFPKRTATDYARLVRKANEIFRRF